MKVFIGPYIDSWSTTRFENWWFNRKYKKRSFAMLESDYDNADKIMMYIMDIWQSVLNNTVNVIQNKRTVKRNVKIHNYDIWGFDETLSYVILPGLKMLKESKHGSAIVDDEDVTDSLNFETNTDEAANELIEMRWDYVLHEMIFAFESKSNDWEDQFHTGEFDYKSVPCDNEGNEAEESDYCKLVKGPNHTAKYDADGSKKYQQRISNGFRLFGKYYESLWD